MLTGLLDVPYRKSFALLEELLERREAEEQTLAISTLATQLKMQQNTILQSVALLQTEIEKKRLGELIFFISKCQRNHILVCTLFPTVVFDALLCKKKFRVSSTDLCL